MSDQDKRLGVYFHIPFCASKCAYCDFCSLPGRDKLMPYYQDALLIQLQETMPRMTDYFIDTVYFGGGTPSYYGARRIVEILQELKVTNRLMKQSEITVECNPDSVRRKELRMLRKEGVNRLSIGAQSANDDILRLIGRRHNWRQVEMAVKRAQGRLPQRESRSHLWSAEPDARGLGRHTHQGARAQARAHLLLRSAS